MSKKLSDAYNVLQEEFIKQVPVGSTVRIMRKAKHEELGWDNVWNETMDEFVGEDCEIMEHYDTNNNFLGIRCYSHEYNDWFAFPFFVLEIIKIKEKKEYNFKPFDQVLVRDSEHDGWVCAHYSHNNSNISFPYITISGGAYRYCIPFKGNEHLVGKKG